MKIPDNSLASFIRFFKESLIDIYDEQELEANLHEVFFHYFNLKRTDLILDKNRNFAESEILTIFKVVKELKTFKPLAYIIGYKEFYGLYLRVTPAVLIPRPETEELVNWILKENKDAPINILDVGTGSGCIALAVKKNLPSSNVTAIDISNESLAIAKVNAAQCNLEVEFKQIDFLNDKLNGKFDLIVSNPPYITEREKSAMHLNVEPHTALFVKKDPLVFYKKLMQSAKEHLQPNGSMYWEINQYYANALLALLKEKKFREIELRNDINNNPRMIKCKVPIEN